MKMDNDSTVLCKKMQTEIESYQTLQKSCVKIVKQRGLLESQLSENKCVLEELNLLGPDNKVYKLFGPVLVKQGLEDSRLNVGKRIQYISKELRTSGETLRTMEKDMVKHREAVAKYQQQLQLAAALK